MSARALVVDDSRSARAFLTRELERHELSVDGVESAEQAIDYLTRQRPDVIFMDHLMPGMDGFQAVQAIKNNPRTATIPIMMYTSQEGELYLSQARALGAIGVLPKQIKHADVSKALEQLHLIRPPGTATAGANAAAAPAADSFAPSEKPIPAVQLSGDVHEIGRERRGPRRPDLPALPPNLRSILDAMFAHHNNEMRRFVVDHMESQADRIVGDMRLLLQDQPTSAAQFPRRPQPVRWGLWLGLAGVAVASLFAVEWFHERTASEQLAAQLAQSQQQLQTVQQNLSSLQAADAAAAASSGAPLGDSAGAGGIDQTSSVEPVPFGEMPLSGARLDQVASLLSRLNSQGFQGVLQVRTIPGRFCMANGLSGQPVLAPDTTPYSKCEQIGNPREDNGTAAQRESVAFANMISTAQRNSAGRIEVQISAGNSDEIQTPYPPVSDALLAGEWNRVAAANNRVELRWQARH
ncbi:MAG TPA: response regulator [Steroidobacteraceae bacterium]|jgi:CheY-like chemotaxis protein|nr:response regulator [Steroidobacteraceae bacterium]